MDIKDIVQISWYGEECIGCACRDLQKDIQRVCGQKTLITRKGRIETRTITVGSMEDADFVPVLHRYGIPEPKGWEQYVLHIENNRILIAGSDSRGTMWGIYRLSRMLGVPAGIRFSEQVERPCRVLEEKEYRSEPFTYRFRGWFLNDEDLLTQWHDGYTRELDYPFYQHITSLESLEYVVETALRMQFNLIIPASFMDIDDPSQEALVAYCAGRGLFVSQHHIEPLGVSHWYYQDYMKQIGCDTEFSYVTKKENLIAAWTHYAEKWAKYREHVIWQLGLRGRGDRPVWDIDGTRQDQEAWGNTISEAIRTQYNIVEKLCGTEFYSTSTLWMEGAELYKNGYLKFPEKTTLIFADVGPTQMMAPDFYEVEREQGRTFGIYYHICYQGDGPHLCQGTDFRKMAYNYGLGVQRGDTEYSILNVSNVREFILSIEANAWLTSRYETFHVEEFCRYICDVYFGNEQAAEVLSGYFDAFASIPEEEVERKYRKYFYLNHGKYAFAYCPASDGQIRTIAWEGLEGTAESYWPEKLQVSIRAFREVLKLAESLSCDEYFRQMLWQIKYMIYLETCCLGCCRYGQTKDRQGLEEAVASLEQIQALHREAEQGVWKNWYRGEGKIGLRRLQKRAEDLLAECGGERS